MSPPRRVTPPGHRTMASTLPISVRLGYTNDHLLLRLRAPAESPLVSQAARRSRERTSSARLPRRLVKESSNLVRRKLAVKDELSSSDLETLPSVQSRRLRLALQVDAEEHASGSGCTEGSQTDLHQSPTETPSLPGGADTEPPNRTNIVTHLAVAETHHLVCVPRDRVK